LSLAILVFSQEIYFGMACKQSVARSFESRGDFWGGFRVQGSPGHQMVYFLSAQSGFSCYYLGHL